MGGEVVLAVRDNGGLGLANEPCLFAMFQRLHDHVEGSGIGLYTVNKLVENAGGCLVVQNQVGVGVYLYHAFSLLSFAGWSGFWGLPRRLRGPGSTPAGEQL